MIAKEKLNEMKKVLGHGYPVLLADKLNKKGILNTVGQPITDNYIRQMFAGRIVNIDVFSIIIDDYKAQKQKITKAINKISKI